MKRNAFTLVEVLASMAVLMILTLALTRMFISASDITSRGMTSIARNSVGESAMEAILSDLDCMVINERISCCKVADVVKPASSLGYSFDTIYFIGTNGDNDDDMPYEYFNFFVQPVTVTNSLGAVYKRFDLVKSRVVMAVGVAQTNSFYALDQKDSTNWWTKFSKLGADQQDREVLAENVVGFEIYCQRWDDGYDIGDNGQVTLHNVNDGVTTKNRWDTDGYSSAYRVTYKPSRGRQEYITNMPPVSFDVKLKLTSPEAAMEGGMLLAADDADSQKRGWELLNREATTLFGRAMPMMGATQFRIQRRAGYNPVSHYYRED